MKKQNAGLATAALGCVCIFAGMNVCPATEPYNFIKEISLSQGGGGSLVIDEKTKRLYAVCSKEIAIIDLDSERVTAEMTNTSIMHDLALVPGQYSAFVSYGLENKIGMVDFGKMRIFSAFHTGSGPAAILCNPNQLVYSFNVGDRTATVYEADDGDFMGKIELPGRPGAVAMDSKTRRIYCCIEDKNKVCVIDDMRRSVLANWTVEPGIGVDGVATDTVNQRLFVACTNRTLELINSFNGKVLATVPIENAGNSVAFDPVNKFVVICGGNGSVTVAHEDTPDKVTVVETLPRETGARAVALSTAAHKMYLSTDGKVLVYGKTLGY